jgi:putative hydrolase of the HAD superfamily
MNQLKAITFDLDDTLFDRTEAQRKTLRLIIQEFNHLFAGFDEDIVAKTFYKSGEIAMQEWSAGSSFEATRISRSKKFLNALGLDEKYADDINEAYLKLYPSINVPVKGMQSVLNQLMGKFQLGVVSNGAPDVQYRKLEKIGVKHLFNCIVISDEVGYRKPDPRIFDIALKLLNRKSEECLHVGDSYNADVLGAKKAGFQACWFNPEREQSLVIDAKPDLEIGSLEELLAIKDISKIL